MLEISWTPQNFSEFLSASLTRSRTPRQHLMLTLCNSSRNEKQELTRVSSSKADFKVHFQAAEQLQMQADGSKLFYQITQIVANRVMQAVLQTLSPVPLGSVTIHVANQQVSTFN